MAIFLLGSIVAYLQIVVLTVLTVLNLAGPGIFYAIFQMVVVDVLNLKSQDVGLDPRCGPYHI